MGRVLSCLPTKLKTKTSASLTVLALIWPLSLLLPPFFSLAPFLSPPKRLWLSDCISHFLFQNWRLSHLSSEQIPSQRHSDCSNLSHSLSSSIGLVVDCVHLIVSSSLSFCYCCPYYPGIQCYAPSMSLGIVHCDH
jgi:hypothetical protein